eukprot:scaffold54755_cov32-Tisochrysis_lutea.AAC.4
MVSSSPSSERDGLVLHSLASLAGDVDKIGLASRSSYWDLCGEHGLVAGVQGSSDDGIGKDRSPACRCTPPTAERSSADSRIQ